MSIDDKKRHGEVKFSLFEKPGEPPWVALKILLPMTPPSGPVRSFHGLGTQPAGAGSKSEYTLFVPSKDLLTEIIEEASNALLALTRAEFRQEKLAKEEPAKEEPLNHGN